MVGASAQFTFSGTQITLVFNRAYNRGVLNVSIDGTQVGTVNEYDPGVLLQQQWTSGVFSAGTHTLLLTHGGGSTYVRIPAKAISCSGRLRSPVPGLRSPRPKTGERERSSAGEDIIFSLSGSVQGGADF